MVTLVFSFMYVYTPSLNFSDKKSYRERRIDRERDERKGGTEQSEADIYE